MADFDKFIVDHDKVHKGLSDKLDCIIEKIDNLNEIEVVNGGGSTVKYNRGEYFQKIHQKLENSVDCEGVEKIVDERIDKAPGRWRKKSALMAADWTKIFNFLFLVIIIFLLIRG